jgi:hypothetical protein
MERKTRFELATLSLARRCSTTEPLPLAGLTVSILSGVVKVEYGCYYWNSVQKRLKSSQQAATG